MPAESRISTLATADGELLHCESWLPEGEPQAGVVLVHGVGEHTGRYEMMAQVLVERGIAVHGWDQRGHGRSTGRRGHVRSWLEYRGDLIRRIGLARIESPSGRPLFLLGHSMGSLVAMDALLHHQVPVAGLVAIGAPFSPVGMARPHLVLLARLLSRLWPEWQIRLPLRTEQLMSDTAQQADLRADTLTHGRVTARWGTEAMRALERVRCRLRDLSLPLLVMHGGLDSVNASEGAELLFQEATSRDKSLRIYPGSRHEPHHDVERAEVMRDLTEWLEQRSGGGGPSY